MFLFKKLKVILLRKKEKIMDVGVYVAENPSSCSPDTVLWRQRVFSTFRRSRSNVKTHSWPHALVYLQTDPERPLPRPRPLTPYEEALLVVRAEREEQRRRRLSNYGKNLKTDMKQSHLPTPELQQIIN